MLCKGGFSVGKEDVVMPDFNQHEKQADSNISFVIELINLRDGSDEQKWKYPDWMITGCFYSAVHIIEADIFVSKSVYFLKDGKQQNSLSINHSKDMQQLFRSESLPTSNHYLRKQIIAADRNGFIDNFVKAYMDLEEMSHRSRYDCYEKCGKDAKRSIKKLNLIVSEFNKRQGTSLNIISE